MSVPEEDALSDANANAYVASEMQALRSREAQPAVTLLGPDPLSSAICCCKGRASLILFTTYVTDDSPLRCGDCFNPVPLYRIPKTSHEEYFDILLWESAYKACDTLNMGSVGERFATRQLSVPDSPLSRHGREVAQWIENACRVPTYSYLQRGTGRSRAAEEKRTCPSCSGHWKRDEPLHELFDFQCVACRLLSNIAWNIRQS